MKREGVFRAATAVSAATLVSRVLGLVREQVIAGMFGAGDATDAFNVAFRIPNLLRNLFAEGAMSASLVPVFTRTRIEEGEERAWQLAGLVFRVLVLFVGILSVLGIVFANPLVRAYAGAFQSVPGKMELTVRMTQLMFPYFPLVVLAAAFMGILNACGKFFLPSLSSALFNLTSVSLGVSFALLISHGHDLGLGLEPIEGLAIGVVFGGAVQAFCQLPQLYRQGYRYAGPQTHAPPRSFFSSALQDPGLRQIFTLMIPGILGLAATQVSVLINTILATSQGGGAVSWLNYAFRLMQFPIGLFGVSLATATLPILSRLWVEKDLPGLSSAVEKALRHTFAINLPASAGLGFLSVPIIELIFEHGRFQASDTHATAVALTFYSIGLTAYAAVKILVPTCYAMGDSRAPVIISVSTIAITLGLNLVLVRWMGFSGLALGTSIGAILNACLLIWVIRMGLRRSGGKLNVLTIGEAFAKNLLLALFMGIAVRFSWIGLQNLVPGASTALRLLRVTLLICEGGLIILMFSRLFGLEDTLETIELLWQKLRKKLSSRGA